MEKEVLVYVDLQGKPHLVGRLWARMRKERESATFEYDTRCSRTLSVSPLSRL